MGHSDSRDELRRGEWVWGLQVDALAESLGILRVEVVWEGAHRPAAGRVFEFGAARLRAELPARVAGLRCTLCRTWPPAPAVRAGASDVVGCRVAGRRGRVRGGGQPGRQERGQPRRRRRPLCPRRPAGKESRGVQRHSMDPASGPAALSPMAGFGFSGEARNGPVAPAGEWHREGGDCSNRRPSKRCLVRSRMVTTTHPVKIFARRGGRGGMGGGQPVDKVGVFAGHLLEG